MINSTDIQNRQFTPLTRGELLSLAEQASYPRVVVKGTSIGGWREWRRFVFTAPLTDIAAAVDVLRGKEEL